ncbi:hypothetical protein F5884DRAFT_751360 [Xylogone sp. PMI_703]|nr:hypothetical protein F5884DRAFT_751360 [Xylogone sp. PMI_703]
MARVKSSPIVSQPPMKSDTQSAISTSMEIHTETSSTPVRPRDTNSDSHSSSNSTHLSTSPIKEIQNHVKSHSDSPMNGNWRNTSLLNEENLPSTHKLPLRTYSTENSTKTMKDFVNFNFDYGKIDIYGPVDEANEDSIMRRAEGLSSFDRSIDETVDAEETVEVAPAGKIEPVITDSLVRPYMNPDTIFDYYDQTDGQAINDSDLSNPERIPKFRYPTIIPMEAFEEYLGEPEELSYEELYHRTAVVASTLAIYQMEWDAIHKVTSSYEAVLKEEERRLDEEAADREEEKGPGGRKRKTRPALANAPFHETKKTKEEIELEKRQRGRLMDPIKFDDMKMMDVYGLEYSSHPKNFGQQNLQEAIKTRAKILASTALEDGRGRSHRTVARKVYDVEMSATPETEFDGPPLKRVRRQRILDGYDTESTHTGTTSRAGTPIRTFPSGKRIGRPPAKSKLQDMQMAPTPDVTEMVAPSGSNPEALDHELPKRKGRPTKALLEAQEYAELQEAASALISATEHGKVSTPPKPKHAGGRPRKSQGENTITSVPAYSTEGSTNVSPSKQRGKGGRPRKDTIESAITVQPNFNLTNGDVDYDHIKLEPVGNGEFGDFDGPNEVFLSTEPDDRSRQGSESTTRPTTSSSQASDSSFGARRSSRPATQEKTHAREARAASKENKKTLKAESTPQTGSSKGKRKQSNANDIEKSLVATPVPAPKKRKINPTPSQNGQTAEGGIQVDVPIIKGVDLDSLDPAAREEAIRKERVRLEKSRKLSANMKLRWATGGMKGAQETRRANNALKKAAKILSEKNAEAGTTWPILPQPPISSNKSSPSIKSSPSTKPMPTIKPKKSTIVASPAPPPPPQPLREPNSKPRRPSRPLASQVDGLDDHDDDNEEERDVQRQFTSEYEQYQALTSPSGRIILGKRVRKPKVNLADLMGSDEFEEEF